MGYPGKNHKSYQAPKRPFEKTRIEAETRLVIEYGPPEQARGLEGPGRAPQVPQGRPRSPRPRFERSRYPALRKQEGRTDHFPAEGRPSRPRRGHRRCPLAQGAGPARTPPADPRVPQGTGPLAETGPAAHHPRAHRDRRQAHQHPRLPREQDRGDPDRLLRHIPVPVRLPLRESKDCKTRVQPQAVPGGYGGYQGRGGRR